MTRDIQMKVMITTVRELSRLQYIDNNKADSIIKVSICHDQPLDNMLAELPGNIKNNVIRMIPFYIRVCEDGVY